MKFIKTIARKLGFNKYEFNLEEHEIIMKATRRLAKIKSINYGGCAISALALYRYMAKMGIVNESTSFKFLYREREFRSVNSVPEPPAHAVIFHNGKYYDSNGLYILDGSRIVKTLTDETTVLRSINDRKTEWNDSFDRKKNCCKIAWSLGVSLKDVKR